MAMTGILVGKWDYAATLSIFIFLDLHTYLYGHSANLFCLYIFFYASDSWIVFPIPRDTALLFILEFVKSGTYSADYSHP